jgi:hypothetical protein
VEIVSKTDLSGFAMSVEIMICSRRSGSRFGLTKAEKSGNLWKVMRVEAQVAGRSGGSVEGVWRECGEGVETHW